MRSMLPSVTVTEAQVITFDFSLVAEGTLSSPVVAKETITGSDPNAASLTLSSPVVTGTSVSTLKSAGTNNCSYVLTCTVNDSTGEVHQKAAAITVTSDAA